MKEHQIKHKEQKTRAWKIEKNKTRQNKTEQVNEIKAVSL